MAAERITYNHNPIEEHGKPLNGVYEQSIHDLKDKGLPQTTLVPEEQLKPNMPNIWRISRNTLPKIWIPNPDVVQHFVKATKADVGGVGGHVEVSKRTQVEVLDHVLRHNRITIKGEDRPIFKSVIATHTGDDVAITGVMDDKVMEHEGAVDELLWDAFKKGEQVAIEEGLYAPGQDLKADAFSGNIHGLGPATVVLPLPVRDRNFSQSVLMATADKAEPGIYNYLTTGAYLDPNYNTGLLIAESKMRNGYVFEIVDVDTKAQALDAGASRENLSQQMKEHGQTERYILLKGPEDYYDIGALTMASSRYVIARVYSRDENGKIDKDPGVVVSAERLHNIETARGFTYGGKDDPVMLALAQGDWPAPGEIASPIAKTPLVRGDCRGSHNLNVYPMPINEQTSFWSGPIMSIITMSINIKTGRIGDISDQFARGTPWDTYRNQAAVKMAEFRASHGYQQPGTLPTDEMEYQPGFNLRIARMGKIFQRRNPVA